MASGIKFIMHGAPARFYSFDKDPGGAKGSSDISAYSNYIKRL